MSRTKSLQSCIKCERGKTWVSYNNVDVLYKRKWWILQFNPNLILPSIRKEFCSWVFVNGKKRGWAEMRYGLIPLSRYRRKRKGFLAGIGALLRIATGLFCTRRERTYLKVHLTRYTYIITYDITDKDVVFCEVYNKDTEEQLGNIIFNPDFTKVVIHVLDEGVRTTMSVIAGYAADVFVYRFALAEIHRIIQISM